MPSSSDLQFHDLRIRNATRHDIDRCCELLGQLAQLESVFVNEPNLQRRGIESLLLRDDAVILLIGIEEKITGMLSCQIICSTAMGGPVGLVEDVIIDHAFRGCGHGSAILNAVQEWAKAQGLLRLCLLAEVENRSAHHFYQRHLWQTSSMQAWYKKII